MNQTAAEHEADVQQSAATLLLRSCMWLVPHILFYGRARRPAEETRELKDRRWSPEQGGKQNGREKEDRREEETAGMLWEEDRETFKCSGT